ncbi:MAG: NAD-dependent epimerase/dehydratase family protein [Bacteroidales bacterium]|jgi:nucleoside-diphosphate-sugar epimerase|nr:NAD-dependent epimerase/dehydratase family protein [Bacteroidales bacterium]
MKQVILGSGGSIGTLLAKELVRFKTAIRLVARNPQPVNATDEVRKANLLDPQQVLEAVEGCSVAYLTVGLPYKASVWEQQWPLIMTNVIDACKKHNCKLVFFDNVYMYDPEQISLMTEETPIAPTSAKGKVRAKIAQMLMDEVKSGNLQALIARSADFYGPGKINSMLNETVLKNFANGKKANWLGRLDVKHAFTYVPDAAKATAMLGNAKDVWGQVWHLPTAPEPLTGLEWMENIAAEMGATCKYNLSGKGLLKVMGWFVPFLGELPEMLYQYDRDYVLDSSKFERRFSFEPTPYVKGIRETVRAFSL